MSEYQEIPRLIRAALAAGGYAADAELSELALRYAGLCREANERLRRCGEYLRRGRRSEAVQLAGCQPDLFELCGALLFPEVPEWERVCGAFALPVAPRLQAEALAELQAAAGREQAMEPLLGRHRLLALAKAPVASRLRLLHAIAERDPENPLWRAELRELEAARLGELRDQAKAAAKAKDAATLERLWAELSQGPWQQQVPPDLSESVTRARELLREQRTAEEMRGLLAQLLRAQAAGAYEQCVGLMAKWQQIVDSRHPSLPVDVRQKVRPVASWLAAEDRRRGVVRKMETLQPRLEASEQEMRKTRLRGRLVSFVALLAVCVLLAVACLILSRANR